MGLEKLLTNSILLAADRYDDLHQTPRVPFYSTANFDKSGTCVWPLWTIANIIIFLGDIPEITILTDKCLAKRETLFKIVLNMACKYWCITSSAMHENLDLVAQVYIHACPTRAT